MPFTAKDAKTHTKKATTAKQQTQWAKVANSARTACMKDGGSESHCDAQAIKRANSIIAEMEEKSMPDIRQITQSVFEIAFASLTGDTSVSETNRLRLLESFNVDFDALVEAEVGEKVSVLEEVGRLVDEARDLTEVAGSLRDTANRIEAAFHAAFSPTDIWDGPYRVRDVFAEHQTLGDAIVMLDKKAGILQAAQYTDSGDAIEFAPRAEWKPVELVYVFKEPMTELHADGVAVEVARDATEADLSEVDAAIETGRRAPVVVDFRLLKPGPGNKKHNHYYPREVLERDAHVFNSVDVFATDHIKKQRSEETKKGKVLECPARFMEDGSPIARVLIYDPDQAEKTRNRADANALDTLECSIKGKGSATPGKVGGKSYRIVQEMTKGLYLDLVSKGGAGGQAQNLVESESGGDAMNDTEEKTTPALDDDQEVQEVDIEESEGEAENETDETPQLLEADEVDVILAEAKLPEFAKERLRGWQYKTVDLLKETVQAEADYIKAVTGSGKPVMAQGKTPEPPKQRTLTERHEAMDAVNKKYLGG